MEKDKQATGKNKLNQYEIERMKTIAANKYKMKAKGFGSLVGKELQKKCDRVANGVTNEICHPQTDTSNLQPALSETNAASIDVNHGRSKKEKQPLIQTLSMADFAKLKAKERQQRSKRAEGSQPQELIYEQRPKQTQQQSITHQPEIQQKKQHKNQQKKQQISKSSTHAQNQKNFCAPGSYSLYVQLQKRKALKEQQGALEKEFENLEEELGLSAGGLRMHQGNVRSVHEGDLDALDDNNVREVHDYDFVEDASNGNNVRDVHEGDFMEDASNGHNDIASETDMLAEKAHPDTQKKKCRGRTILAHVHNWEKREYILLNDMGQPAGPTKEVVETFTRFLGTIAKDAALVPLNFISWKYVPTPTKDKIWEYVLKRFDISVSGKKHVLETINADWRTYKSRIKKEHYSKYTTMEERLANRPEHVPDNQFRDLLKYWDSKEAQEISKINKENRQKQGDMHTMGPCSFSMLRANLKEKNPDNQEPSQAEVYIESRKRKAGREYLTPNEETLKNIEKLIALKTQDGGGAKIDPYFDVLTKKEHGGRVRLYGRGVTKSTLEKRDPDTPYILPPMLLQNITKKFEKDMEELLEKKFSDFVSRIREANGDDVIIPDFQSNEVADGDDASSQGDDEAAESTVPSCSQ